MVGREVECLSRVTGAQMVAAQPVAAMETAAARAKRVTMSANLG
jgi:hypothetical protein